MQKKLTAIVAGILVSGTVLADEYETALFETATGLTLADSDVVAEYGEWKVEWEVIADGDYLTCLDTSGSAWDRGAAWTDDGVFNPEGNLPADVYGQNGFPIHRGNAGFLSAPLYVSALEMKSDEEDSESDDDKDDDAEAETD